MGLSSYTQIRFPGCPGAFGLVTLVINRPGHESLAQAEVDTLKLGEGGEYYPFIIDGDFSLSKKFTTTRGRRALDDLTVGIRDGLSYSGTVDSNPVSEDFTSAFKTFFDVWFTSTLPYKAFLLYHDNETGNDEVTHVGWIDPTYAPSSDAYLFHALTDEQIWLGTRTLKMTALAQAQITLTWNDVLKNISSSDCQEGTAYNGFALAPQGLIGQSNTRANIFSSSKGQLEQAAIYTQRDWTINPARIKVPAAVWTLTPWTVAANSIAQVGIFFTPGTGYAAGDTGTINGSTGVFATYVVYSVGGGGAITGWNLTSAGSGYNVGTTIGTTATSGVGTGLTIDIVKVTTGVEWGPSGLVFIKLSTLFNKIALTLGITAPTVVSALKWWKQISSGNNFPIDTANPIDPGDLYISLNVFAKCHPYDGSYWDNPVGFSPDTPATEVLSSLCNMILCDFNIAVASDGSETLNLTPMGETAGTLPDWKLIGSPQQEEPATGARVVQAKYRGDDLTIQSPLGVVGDASSIEIPARIHRIGKTSGADTMPDAECLTFDSKLPIGNQEDCLRIAWYDAGNGVTTIIPDCWKGLCFLYWFHSGSGNPGVYPTNWQTLDNTNDWSNSFFCVNAITRAKNSDGSSFTAAADLQAQISGNDYFNLRDYTAVAFAALTLPQPTVQVLTFSGISDSSGSIQAVKAGLSKQWRFGSIADKTWVAIQIDQLLLLGQTSIKFQQYGDINGFPALTDLSYGAVNGTGGTSSSTGSATGGGSVNTDPKTIDYDFPVTSVTLSAASTNNVSILTSLVNQTQAVIVNNTHGADVTITGILAPSQNCTMILYNTGAFNLILALSSGSSSAANRINGTAFSNVIGTIRSGGGALLMYDTVNSHWQIVNIFPLPAEEFDTTYFIVTQSAAGAPIITLVTGWLVPSQTGSNGKFLKTNGSTSFWDTIAANLIAGTNITLSEDGTHRVTINATASGMTNPMTTLGDIIYEDGTPTPARLAGNTTSTQKFLAQTGTGTISAVPSWVAIALPVGANPSASVGLSAVNGSAATFLRSDGAPALSQAIVPTWTGLHTFNGAAIISAPAATLALAITGASGVAIVNFTDSAAQLIMSIIGGAGNVINLGDTSAISAGAAVLSITQRNNTEIGLIIKQVTGGAAVQQWRNSADTVMAQMDSTGLIVGGTTPAARIHGKNVAGALISRFEDGVTMRDRYQKEVTTTNAVATLIFNLTTSNNQFYHVRVTVKGEETAGPNIHKGIGFVLEAFFQNNAGTLTVGTVATVCSLNNLGGGSTVTLGVGAVNTTDIEVNVTGKNAETIPWECDVEILL